MLAYSSFVKNSVLDTSPKMNDVECVEEVLNNLGKNPSKLRKKLRELPGPTLLTLKGIVTEMFENDSGEDCCDENCFCPSSTSDVFAKREFHIIKTELSKSTKILQAEIRHNATMIQKNQAELWKYFLQLHAEADKEERPKNSNEFEEVYKKRQEQLKCEKEETVMTREDCVNQVDLVITTSLKQNQDKTENDIPVDDLFTQRNPIAKLKSRLLHCEDRKSPAVEFNAIVVNTVYCNGTDWEMVQYVKVTENIGQGFNEETCTFTTPSTGQYIFSVSNEATDSFVVDLLMNGKLWKRVNETETGDMDFALELQQEDVLGLRVNRGSIEGNNKRIVSVFKGRRL